MPAITPEPSSALSSGPPMADVVYFEETLDGHVYVGWSGDHRRRRRDHQNDGKSFLAALPGSETDEKRLHEFFKPDLVRGKSTYRGDRIVDFVAWLVCRGFATVAEDHAQRLPRLPFDVWRPDRAGDAFTESGGQMVLIPPVVSPRERVAYISDYVHLTSETDEWLTPPEVIERARRALGGHIDTDPATRPEANAWIKAQYWYTRTIDGLSPDNPWQGTVWLNPPYGRGESSAGRFTDRLVAELDAHTITAAITCLNLNSASSLWFDAVWRVARCHLVWRNRLNFVHPNGDESAGASKGTILSYFGPAPGAFAAAFLDCGILIETTTGRP